MTDSPPSPAHVCVSPRAMSSVGRPRLFQKSALARYCGQLSGSASWIEHTLAPMKCWKIFRGYRRAASTLTDAVSGIAHLHNIVQTD